MIGNIILCVIGGVMMILGILMIVVGLMPGSCRGDVAWSAICVVVGVILVALGIVIVWILAGLRFYFEAAA